MENITKFLMYAAMVSIAGALISVIFYVYKTGDRSYKLFSSKVLEIFSNESEPDFVKFSGQYVDGKTVRAILEKEGGDYFFKIKTKKNPVSFPVVNRPYQNRIVVSFQTDGTGSTGKYADYSDPNTVYYIDNNAVFSTRVLRDDFGTTLGAQFTEKGTGVVQAAIKKEIFPEKKEDISKGFFNPTLDQLKVEYTTQLDEAVKMLDASNLKSTVLQLQNALAAVQTNTEKLLTEAGAIRPEVDTSARETYNELTKKLDALKESINGKWKQLINQFNNTHQSDDGGNSASALGHYDISQYSPGKVTDDNRDLQFWLTQEENKDNDVIYETPVPDGAEETIEPDVEETIEPDGPQDSDGGYLEEDDDYNPEDTSGSDFGGGR